jgi:hypothetical protein
MNQFLQSAIQMIELHGVTSTYTKVTNGSYDPNTGSVTNTETSFTVKTYPKHIKATQFNYPNLIGKDAVLVYLPGNTSVGTPDTSDKITIGSDVYTVDSFQKHIALGEVCLYRIVAVKG